MGKAEENKKKKQRLLLDAAFELFENKGVQHTAINDIVKRAGVAKGTFYLYFKDKYDILDKIITKKTTILINEALSKSLIEKFESFDDQFIFIINYIIDVLDENRLLLKLIYKNLSFGIFEKSLLEIHDEKTDLNLLVLFNNKMKESHPNIEKPDVLLFLILELTGSCCYSSLVYEKPMKIKEMKPYIFKAIKKMMSD